MIHAEARRFCTHTVTALGILLKHCLFFRFTRLLCCGIVCTPAASLAIANSTSPRLNAWAVEKAYRTASGTMTTRFTETVNVVRLGADPTGAADSAWAFRSALGSGRRVVVPPGVYLFDSTEPTPCCAFDRTSVLVQGLSDFEIVGDRAIIIIGDKIALSSAFHVDRSQHFVIRGLTIRGNRAGLKSTQENAGLAFSSDTDFLVEDIHFSGDFGGNGAAIVGDWLVKATFKTITADAVGHCLDLAYLRRVRISNVIARGAGSQGGETSGQTCISVIEDPPNAGQNHTGIPFRTTEGVIFSEVEESNFNTGALIAAGRQYRLSGNYWHDNGDYRTAQGIGVLIKHSVNSGAGVPKDGVEIVGDRFARNSRKGIVETIGAASIPKHRDASGNATAPRPSR